MLSRSRYRRQPTHNMSRFPLWRVAQMCLAWWWTVFILPPPKSSKNLTQRTLDVYRPRSDRDKSAMGDKLSNARRQVEVDTSSFEGDYSRRSSSPGAVFARQTGRWSIARPPTTQPGLIIFRLCKWAAPTTLPRFHLTGHGDYTSAQNH